MLQSYLHSRYLIQSRTINQDFNSALSSLALSKLSTVISRVHGLDLNPVLHHGPCHAAPAAAGSPNPCHAAALLHELDPAAAVPVHDLDHSAAQAAPLMTPQQPSATLRNQASSIWTRHHLHLPRLVPTPDLALAPVFAAAVCLPRILVYQDGVGADSTAGFAVGAKLGVEGDRYLAPETAGDAADAHLRC